MRPNEETPRAAEDGAGAWEADQNNESAQIVPLPSATRPVRRKRKGQYMALFVDRMLCEMAPLSPEARGCYITLLCVYWSTAQPLPDDDVRLAQMSGAGARWRKVRAQLEPLFVIGQGTWRHDHLDDERTYFQQRSAAQRGNVLQRWAKARGGSR